MNRMIKFRAWDILNQRMINLNEGMSSIPYYELFCDTPDSRAVELMQFTGRQPRKTDLYEGDVIHANIIKYSIATMGVITWDNEHSWWANKNDAGLTGLHELNGIKILGNIHTNPELLEQSS